MSITPSSASSLEAKIVVLGSQGVGKTSLVHRYVKHDFIAKPQSTVGASFLTARVHDAESGYTIRLQIWDTAGQERYRSISRLYYRGAHAAILCYDITDERTFHDMGVWLKELKECCGLETIIHFVGTKTDVVAREPEKRRVPFEQCMEFVARQWYPDLPSTGSTFSQSTPPSGSVPGLSPPSAALMSPHSNRSSGFWGQDHIWNCHEVSAKDGDGIDEVFRVITRELVDQHLKKESAQRQQQQQRALATPLSRGRTPGDIEAIDHAQDYFNYPGRRNSVFRPGGGGDGDPSKRRSWLGFPTPATGESLVETDSLTGGRRGRNGQCC